jgi:hypothetical protein
MLTQLTRLPRHVTRRDPSKADGPKLPMAKRSTHATSSPQRARDPDAATSTKLSVPCADRHGDESRPPEVPPQPAFPNRVPKTDSEILTVTVTKVAPRRGGVNDEPAPIS